MKILLVDTGGVSNAIATIAGRSASLRKAPIAGGFGQERGIQEWTAA